MVSQIAIAAILPACMLGVDEVWGGATGCGFRSKDCACPAGTDIDGKVGGCHECAVAKIHEIPLMTGSFRIAPGGCRIPCLYVP